MGWRRLSFRTGGLREARHRILGMGMAVRAEEPAELVAWLREQAATMQRMYAQGPEAGSPQESDRAQRDGIMRERCEGGRP